MTLENISTLVNILASLSVIATLGIVTYQIRQNTIAMRMNSATMSTQLFIENLGRVVENADLAELLTRSVEDEEKDFTEGERLRLTNFFSASFRLYEMQYMHRLAGHFEEDLWQGTERRLHRSLHFPRMRDLWHDNKEFYAPKFVNHVGMLIQRVEEQPEYVI